MTSNTLSEFYKTEYSLFLSRLRKEWHISAESSSLGTILRPLYKRYLGLSCISSIVGNGLKRNEYILGIPEASFCSIILALRGLENPSSVLLRQSIELTLKHIYFSSHPVEYQWANISTDYKEPTCQFLLEYLSKTIECKTILKEGIINQLQSDFAVLSRYVHVHSKHFIVYTSKSTNSKTVLSVLSTISKVASRLWPILSLLIIVHSLPKYIKSSHLEKKITRNIMPTALKKCLDEHLRQFHN
jgi:hypothetical protein